MNLKDKVTDNIYFGLVLFTSFLINLIPSKIALNLMGSVIRFVSLTQKKRRKIIRENFKLIFRNDFPEWRIKILTNLIYRNFGMSLSEFLRLDKFSRENISKKVELRNPENLDKALENGKGALILTAHIGNWDLMATAVGLFGYKVNLITKIFKHGNLVNKYWMRQRKHGGVNPIYYKRSIFQIKKALEQNELVGFVIDQYVPNASVTVDFLGKPASTFDALAAMAYKFNVPVVPILNHRSSENKYKIIIDVLPPLNIIESETKPETIRKNTQIYSDLISDYIRKYPDQWIWMHRRWRKI